MHPGVFINPSIWWRELVWLPHSYITEAHIDDDWELSQTTQDVVPDTCVRKQLNSEVKLVDSSIIKNANKQLWCKY